ncbi:site-specific integrase [bacterium]|nr:site-specific integrase [bacterium]
MATLVTNSRSPFFYFKFRIGEKQISRRIDPPIEHSPKAGSSAESRIQANRNRQQAQSLADKAEEIALLASGGADPIKVRNFLASVVEEVAGKSIRPDSTRKIYFNWLEREQKKGKNPETLANYEARIRRFLDWLGKRAEEPADSLTLTETQAFYDLRAKTVSPTTVKKEFEVLQIAFSVAVKKGLFSFNPWAGIERVKQFRRKGQGARKAFTEEQIRKLLATAEGEMAGLIYLQAYAGLRLGDAKELKWSSVDFEGAGGVGVISFIPDKDSYGKEHHEPLHPNLKAYLLALKKKAKKGEQYVFPDLSKREISGNRGLSRMFKNVMREAGISCEWQKGHGEQGKRVATLSNHSLRYFFLSQLRESGVQMENRMDLIGHQNEAVHRGYSAIEMRVLGKELAKVPAVPAPPLVS